MDAENLNISFHGVKSVEDSGISLEMYQEIDNELLGYPSFADINAMIMYARSGKSAHQILADNKYATITSDSVIIELPFYLRPYPQDLAYSFVHNVTSLSSRKVVEKNYVSTLAIALSDKIDFPAELLIGDLKWKSPAYNSAGQIIPYPDYTVYRNSLIFDESIFGIIKLNYTLIEHNYIATLVIPKTNTTQVTSVNPVITAAYVNNSGEPQVSELTLQYPDIVLSFLETCPDDPERMVIDWSTSNIDKKTSTTYYYSTCTGEIIGTVRKDL